jgi:tripartite-type tricarboxylate transporter receptor subunit TctC
MFATLAITHRQVKAQKLKALGVSTTRRAALLPHVPTIAESGVKDYAMSTWWGVIAPSGVSNAIVAKINRETAAVLGQPDAVQRLENDGAEPAPMPSAEFARVLASEVEKWKRVAREANIKAE